MEVETRAYKVIEKTEIELIEDVWKRCTALDWDSGRLWDEQIAPHKEGTLVKVTTQIIPIHHIVKVELVTNAMIAKAIGDVNVLEDEA